MNCLSLNIRGIGGRGKSGKIKHLKNVHGISFIGLQETMVSNISPGLVSNFWGGMGFEYDFVNAYGNSGGLMCLWDPKVFSKELVNKDRNFLHVAGWWIVFGDFNAVRDRDERKNSAFDPVCARDFNNFIDEAGLREYDLKGLKFTCMTNRKSVCKFSRIDRVLVCDNVFIKWPNACVRAINRDCSDHSPLVFSVKDSNFGPEPFRLFDSWLDRPGCLQVIETVMGGWRNEGKADLNLLTKLKRLRGCLRDWFKVYSANEIEEETRLRKEKDDIEIQMENNDLEDADMWIWTECKKALEEIEILKARDIKQKSRVKWAALGDENSNFFITW
ncbi:uncharacterized protein LOC110944976 [Helianthus annuus]|uniref:uncharacterized protein LOC110944976 n=1 Tax=Helianthus annuus TaxID=4232 RepID=UPI000B8F23B5|nr:uncharacterized protein LOC110944976 [Helianthus annuus]